MKALARGLIVLLALGGTHTYSQGLIGFANNPLSPIQFIDGSFLENGIVGLYWSADLNADPRTFELGGTSPIFVSGIFNNGGMPLALSAPAGTPVLVEIRVWDNLSASSFEEALALGVGYLGCSGVLNVMTLTAPPDNPPNLVVQGGFTGLEPRPLSGGLCIPEPSTWVWGLLGVGLLGVYLSMHPVCKRDC